MYSGHGKKTQIKFPVSIHLKFANNGRKTTHLKVLHGKLDLELPIARHVKELPWQYHIIDKLKAMDSHPGNKTTTSHIHV